MLPEPSFLTINFRWSFLFIFLALFPLLLPAQSTPDTVQSISPFSQGSLLVNLRGSISSATYDGINLINQEKESSNSFGINLGLGFLVLDRFAIGGNLTTYRQENRSIINRESELLLIGPFFRYFLTNNPRGSLYPNLSISYARFFERNSGSVNNLAFDRTLRGGGIGIIPGIGYTYVFKGAVGFDLSINYRLIFIDGKLVDDISESTSNEYFDGSEMTFSFGFVLFLNTSKP